MNWIVIIAIFGGCAGAVYWAMRKSGSVDAAFDAQAAEFERSAMAAAGAVTSRSSYAVAPMIESVPAQSPTPAPAAPHRAISEPTPARPTEQGSVAESIPAEISPTVTAPGDADFIESVCARLQAANIFGALDGPIRTNNPAIVGKIVSLKNGKRLAVLEHEFRAELTELDALMRHVEGVLAPGPAGEPVFVKRFSDYLSDSIGMG